MLFWILVAFLTAAVAAILLYPLLRGAKAAENTRAGEAAVYRDQLLELDRDLAGGLISAEEADYARAEIGRRLIAVSGVAPAGKSKPLRHHRVTEAFIVLLLPIIGLCLYMNTGRPELPSQPLQARLANPGNDIAVLVAKAERHLAQNPDDGKGWDVLAPIYFNTMRASDAETAYRNAIRLLGPSPARLDGLAETLMAIAEGVVTEDARKILEQSLSLEPNNPRARFYIALSLEQAGKSDEARGAFEELAKQSPADAPWLPLVNEHIAKNGGTAVAAQVPPAAQSAAPGGPTAEDVAAAETMSSGDRQQMIRTMVESLDAKLSADPNNFDGWMRLIRSYAVLNDKDRAADALKRGLAAFPAPGEEGKQLLALAKELGIAADGSVAREGKSE
ncbi:cytochrome c-type biogenesis protein CcmH [Rhizobium sp. BK529]|uniref:c-type cytochrome biogenesis protein CcmI n=1 Tax=unclassified Rhizobium TaxID=2613769 RepID=UPI00104613F1|nr:MULTISPECIES: c-type cytochrome biogenesis protein CcmI [unclassified Rhizobium]MBB3591975.1 cytochrome c-type biogenesis protein CcmH [Rhizobium sp. BK529]TCS06399.1 cytochrome c-type biogenesis protein CcmH [Rhizobium sp. BK418]